MPRYAYKAFREGGAAEASVLTAQNKEEAARVLRARGYHVMALREERRPLFRAHPFQKAGHLALLCRETAALLSAGLPLTETLTLLSAGGKKREKEILAEALAAVEGGQPLAGALSLTGEFPAFFLALTAVGEESGTLAEELAGLAEYYEKERAFRRSVAQAAAYPLFLFLFAAFLFLLVLIVILPAFALLFQSLGLALPAPTRWALALGGFFKTYGAGLLLFFAGVFTLGAWVSRSGAGKARRDRILLRSRFVKRLLLVRFCHALAALLQSGAPLSDALTKAAGVCGNEEARARILCMADGLARGGSFADGLETSGFTLPLLTHMAAAGMKSGELPAFLSRAARLLADDTLSRLARFKALLEPTLLLLSGLLTAALLFTVLLPIFTAIGNGF